MLCPIEPSNMGELSEMWVMQSYALCFVVGMYMLPVKSDAEVVGRLLLFLSSKSCWERGWLTAFENVESIFSFPCFLGFSFRRRGPKNGVHFWHRIRASQR